MSLTDLSKFTFQHTGHFFAFCCFFGISKKEAFWP